MLEQIFEKEKIEYFAALPFDKVKSVNPRLLSRLGFVPKTVIVFLVPYYAGETENISRYAASCDYHYVIRSITDRIISELRAHFPDAGFSGFTDHSPIAEQSAALIGGLGILGDNGLLINEKYGSYVFIGDVLTDVSPKTLGAIEPREISTCVGCGACRRACPTGILRGEASDCLSAITQRKGELTSSEAELMYMYNTVWGCDVCQTVCPYNTSPMVTPIQDFHEKRITRLCADTLEGMSDEEFSRRAFSWRGKAVPLRNVLLVEKLTREKQKPNN